MKTAQKAATVSAHLNRSLLSEEGVECTLLALAPGEQTAGSEPHFAQEHVLFVVEGSVNVHLGELTYLVNNDGAIHIPADRNYAISATPSGWAKVLRVDFTRRTVVEAPLFTVAHP